MQKCSETEWSNILSLMERIKITQTIFYIRVHLKYNENVGLNNEVICRGKRADSIYVVG